MKVDLKAIGKTLLAIVAATYPAVALVEEGVIDLLQAKTGKEKQDAALKLIMSSVTLTEGVVGKDLLNDAEVQAATRSVIDAVVALQNVLAKKRAASSPTEAGTSNS